MRARHAAATEAAPKLMALRLPESIDIDGRTLAERLDEHAAWLDSRHVSGEAANLAGRDLHEVDLHGRDLRLCNLAGTNLRGCDLSGARLSGADLSNANLRDSILAGADFADQAASSQVPTQLTGAEFRGIALEKVLKLGIGQVEGTP